MNAKYPDRTIHMWVTPEELEWLKQMRLAKVCSEKKPYDSETIALREAIRRTMKAGAQVPRLRAYLCPVCGKWHLTKLDKWEEPK